MTTGSRGLRGGGGEQWEKKKEEEEDKDKQINHPPKKRARVATRCFFSCLAGHDVAYTKKERKGGRVWKKCSVFGFFHGHDDLRTRRHPSKGASSCHPPHDHTHTTPTPRHTQPCAPPFKPKPDINVPGPSFHPTGIHPLPTEQQTQRTASNRQQESLFPPQPPQPMPRSDDEMDGGGGGRSSRSRRATGTATTERKRRRSKSPSRSRSRSRSRGGWGWVGGWVRGRVIVSSSFFFSSTYVCTHLTERTSSRRGVATRSASRETRGSTSRWVGR